MGKKLTQEEFIRRAREKHEDKYDYSKATYVNGTTKVKIVCSLHGEFLQTPADHLSGKGCKQCGIEKATKNKIKCLDTFLSRAKEVHGNLYDYSLVKEHKTKDKITIICKEHGKFEQESKSHTYGVGCPNCGSSRGGLKIRRTRESFIEDANKVHNNFYDYNLVEYETVEDNVSIICQKHGVFRQTPHAHLSGQGCRDCGYERNSELFGLSWDDFLQRAKEVHGYRYEYISEGYKNLSSKIKIRCKKHGYFKQSASNHINGYNCPECYSEVRGNSLRNSTEGFISKAIEKHGEKYNYSLVDYKNSHTYVDIICKSHGAFKQLPYDHTNGHGCKKCGALTSNYKFKHLLTVPAEIYYISFSVNGKKYFKIGVTTVGVESRFFSEKLDDLSIIKTWKYNYGYMAYERERVLLKKYGRSVTNDSPLTYGGNSEVFERDVMELCRD